MDNLALVRKHITPKSTRNPRLLLRLMESDEMTKAGLPSNRRFWKNEAGEVYASWVFKHGSIPGMDFSHPIIAIAPVRDTASLDGLRPSIGARLIQKKGETGLWIADLRHHSNWEYDKPRQANRGRGFFGVALAEAILHATEQGIDVIRASALNLRLEQYYMNYGFVIVHGNELRKRI